MAETNQSRSRNNDEYYFGPSPPSSVFYAATFRSCCCFLFLLLTFLGLLALFIALALFLVFKPQNPSFDLDHVSVHRLVVTLVPAAAAAAAPAAAQAYHVSLNLTLDFVADNPNKVTICYDPAGLNVTCRGAPLGVVALPRFAQPACSRRVVQSMVAAEGGFNMTPAGGGGVDVGGSMHDYVELRVTGDVRATIRALGVTSRLQVTVECVMKISTRKQDLILNECGGI